MINTCDVNKIFSELAGYIRIKEQADAEIKRLQADIKNYLLNSGSDEFIGSEHRVTYKIVQSTRVDTTKLKKLYPEIAKECSTKSESRRFVFK